LDNGYAGQLFSNSLFCICKKEGVAGSSVYPFAFICSANTDLASEMIFT
jgi:hypothetical protein